jgi:hypothetical protein
MEPWEIECRFRARRDGENSARVFVAGLPLGLWHPRLNAGAIRFGNVELVPPAGAREVLALFCLETRWSVETADAEFTPAALVKGGAA